MHVMTSKDPSGGGKRKPWNSNFLPKSHPDQMRLRHLETLCTKNVQTCLPNVPLVRGSNCTCSSVLLKYWSCWVLVYSSLQIRSSNRRARNLPKIVNYNAIGSLFDCGIVMSTPYNGRDGIQNSQSNEFLEPKTHHTPQKKRTQWGVENSIWFLSPCHHLQCKHLRVGEILSKRFTLV